MVCMPASGFSNMEPKGIANMYTETPASRIYALGVDEHLFRYPKQAILYNNGVHAGGRFFPYGAKGYRQYVH